MNDTAAKIGRQICEAIGGTGTILFQFQLTFTGPRQIDVESKMLYRLCSARRRGQNEWCSELSVWGTGNALRNLCTSMTVQTRSSS